MGEKNILIPSLPPSQHRYRNYSHLVIVYGLVNIIVNLEQKTIMVVHMFAACIVCLSFCQQCCIVTSSPWSNALHQRPKLFDNRAIHRPLIVVQYRATGDPQQCYMSCCIVTTSLSKPTITILLVLLPCATIILNKFIDIES